MDRRVASALRRSPLRTEMQYLILLRDVVRKKKLKIIITINLPSLQLLIENVTQFVCLHEDNRDADAYQLLIRHANAALIAHIKMVHGLIIILRFKAEEVYRHSRTLLCATDVEVQTKMRVLTPPSRSAWTRRCALSRRRHGPVSPSPSCSSKRRRTETSSSDSSRPSPSPPLGTQNPSYGYLSVDLPPEDMPGTSAESKRKARLDEPEIEVNLIDEAIELMGKRKKPGKPRPPVDSPNITMTEDDNVSIRSVDYQRDFYSLTLQYGRKIKLKTLDDENIEDQLEETMTASDSSDQEDPKKLPFCIAHGLPDERLPEIFDDKMSDEDYIKIFEEGVQEYANKRKRLEEKHEFSPEVERLLPFVDEIQLMPHSTPKKNTATSETPSSPGVSDQGFVIKRKRFGGRSRINYELISPIIPVEEFSYVVISDDDLESNVEKPAVGNVTDLIEQALNILDKEGVEGTIQKDPPQLEERPKFRHGLPFNIYHDSDEVPPTDPKAQQHPQLDEPKFRHGLPFAIYHDSDEVPPTDPEAQPSQLDVPKFRHGLPFNVYHDSDEVPPSDPKAQQHPQLDEPKFRHGLPFAIYHDSDEVPPTDPEAQPSQLVDVPQPPHRLFFDIAEDNDEVPPPDSEPQQPSQLVDVPKPTHRLFFDIDEEIDEVPPTDSEPRQPSQLVDVPEVTHELPYNISHDFDELPPTDPEAQQPPQAAGPPVFRDQFSPVFRIQVPQSSITNSESNLGSGDSQGTFFAKGRHRHGKLSLGSHLTSPMFKAREQNQYRTANSEPNNESSSDEDVNEEDPELQYQLVGLNIGVTRRRFELDEQEPSDDELLSRADSSDPRENSLVREFHTFFSKHANKENLPEMCPEMTSINILDQRFGKDFRTKRPPAVSNSVLARWSDLMDPDEVENYVPRPEVHGSEGQTQPSNVAAAATTGTTHSTQKLAMQGQSVSSNLMNPSTQTTIGPHTLKRDLIKNRGNVIVIDSITGEEMSVQAGRPATMLSPPPAIPISHLQSWGTSSQQLSSITRLTSTPATFQSASASKESRIQTTSTFTQRTQTPTVHSEPEFPTIPEVTEQFVQNTSMSVGGTICTFDRSTVQEQTAFEDPDLVQGPPHATDQPLPEYPSIPEGTDNPLEQNILVPVGEVAASDMPTVQEQEASHIVQSPPRARDQPIPEFEFVEPRPVLRPRRAPNVPVPDPYLFLDDMGGFREPRQRRRRGGPRGPRRPRRPRAPRVLPEIIEIPENDEEVLPPAPPRRVFRIIDLDDEMEELNLTEPVEREADVFMDLTEPVEREADVFMDLTEPVEGEADVFMDLTEPVEGEADIFMDLTDTVGKAPVESEDFRFWDEDGVEIIVRRKALEKEDGVIRFSDCCEPNKCSKRSAASFFHALLRLSVKNVVQLYQTEPTGDPTELFIKVLKPIAK